ncbi:TetR/AcrR family transcriptional regulator [Rhodococcus sp. ACPA4]|jgi:AcrR family transcriptional regulator|uniref:TetR family transcriptional regulator n=2 Tax=Nocardiaceae TaxID=85025 RepID=A0A652YKZ4_NOCGL|nr:MULTISPECIES: TetR/AcrR family transcriptional regulator [Rhodococcus]NMD61840.1 helix-turn-helix transcriptional regulator [Nocardia globerula]KJF22309.1 Bacterial regulatory protein, tetR family [Rhodococcus sp. AD45]MCE4268603.1 helix-turn-helix transcriptional regulator [Rhodococcus globerulus]MDV6265524.1 helix-turn-helix domain-containing protein [Rhodococcus globerulus]MDV8067951.1 helix-turn-helix domain-containing protein [Rhodococcus sp. IEGM 1366]
MAIRNADDQVLPRKGDGQRTPNLAIDNLILDAARSCVLDFGMQRTTLAEIARRAGVSRPTVYRRWTDTRAVVADLLTREIREVLPDIQTTGSARDLLLSAVVDVVAEIRDHPLFVKIRSTDQELLTTYIVDRIGASQKSILELMTAVVTAGQQDGSIRHGNADEIASMLLLMAQSVVFSAPTLQDRLSADAAVQQLRIAVSAYLTPTAGTDG